MDFTRDPGPLTLPGLRGQNQAMLRLEMDRAGLEGAWVVADLSLGAWQGHQVAREFCAQLAIDLPFSEVPAAPERSDERSRDVSYADIIGEFIDAEARGDQATINSLDFASRIRARLLDGAPRMFLVMAPRYGMPWETENVLFIRLFAQALRGTRCGLALLAAGDSDPAVPPDWKIDWRGGLDAAADSAQADIVGLVPGVIAPDLADTLRRADLPQGDLIPLANGHWLIPAERRRHPKDVPRLDFDRLGLLARPFGWLDAYSQFYGNKMYVEPWFLYSEGRRRFAEGGTGITLRLMERAIAHVTMGLDWGILQSYAQGLRVALHRFVDATGIRDPPTTLPADLRSFLLQCKGWGLVMIDEPARAEECFRQARGLTDPARRDRREYLYLLNISALCRLKAGEIESALALEREIEERRERLSPPDRRLHYVNSINIARLHRRRGDMEKAEEYFCDAFTTTLGARTGTDAIYANVMLAKLNTTSGRHAEAFTCWMRAALHWAASEVPEAMGERIVRHILGQELKPGFNMPEAIAASLTDSILAAAAVSGIDQVSRGLHSRALDRLSAPVFVHTEWTRRERPNAAIDRAFLSGGLSVLAIQAAVEPHIVGEHSLRLRVLLYTILEALAPPAFLTGAGAIVVDDSLGREIPATWEELVAACVRLDVRDVAIDGVVMTLPVETRERLERRLRVRVGCAVETVVVHDGSAVVLFKRYLPPTVLTIEESHLLALVEGDRTVDEIVRRCEDIGSSEDVLPMLRGLEQKRVVNLDPPDRSTLVAELQLTRQAEDGVASP